MKDVVILSDLEQIKCISQAYRIAILHAFQESPSTAKMISERLGEPHAKVNYHIKEMTKHGILSLVDEVVKMGIVEKYYQPVAKRLVVDSESMKFSEKEIAESFNQYFISVFDQMSKDFYGCIAERSGKGIKILLSGELYLDDAHVTELHRELVALIDKYDALQSDAKDAKCYTLGGVIIPIKEGR